VVDDAEDVGTPWPFILRGAQERAPQDDGTEVQRVSWQSKHLVTLNVIAGLAAFKENATRHRRVAMQSKQPSPQRQRRWITGASPVMTQQVLRGLRF
jgi:hypothetical protein